MNDYSIEMSAEKINDSRTKRYFAEVYGCYSAGYYRSAVVMLWSIVVTDILFKLDQLSTAYGDATAKAILAEIGELRKSNPKSPEWESELVNKVASRTDLVDYAELTFLQSLQSHRHLSAHPVMTGVDALFSPNKETARAHIRNILDAVLTKPPIMSRKVFDVFIEDVEQIGRLRPGAEGLRKYLEAKYFCHFSGATFAHVFKSLWRVTFKSMDARAEANRRINTDALKVLFSTKTEVLVENIKAERDLFSDVSFGDSHLFAMIEFFRENPNVFSILNDAAKAPIQDYSALSLEHFALCWFLSQNPKKHIEEVVKRINNSEVVKADIFVKLHESLSTTDTPKEAFYVGIRLYFMSSSFAVADSRFDEFVRPFMLSYEKEHFLAFLEGCKDAFGGQSTGRGRARRDHREIKALIDSKFTEIQMSSYKDFTRSIED